MRELGGLSEYNYDHNDNDALQRHANRPLLELKQISHVTSFDSASDVFYSCPSSPNLRPVTPPLRSSASLNRQPWHQSWDFHHTTGSPQKTVSFLDLDGTRHRCNSMTPYNGARPRSFSVSSANSTDSSDSFRTAPMYQPTKRHRRHDVDDPLSLAAASLLDFAGHVQGLFRFIADAVLLRARSSLRQEGGLLRAIWKRIGFTIFYYVLLVALMSNTHLLARVTNVWKQLRITALPGQNDL